MVSQHSGGKWTWAPTLSQEAMSNWYLLAKETSVFSKAVSLGALTTFRMGAVPRSRGPALNTQWILWAFVSLCIVWASVVYWSSACSFLLVFLWAFVCVFLGFCSVKREREWRWVSGEDPGEVGEEKAWSEYKRFFSIKIVGKSWKKITCFKHPRAIRLIKAPLFGKGNTSRGCLPIQLRGCSKINFLI